MKNPVEIATSLAKHYGHKLEKPIIYTQGVALSGRIRVQTALGGADKTLEDIERIVSPYLIQPSSTFGMDDGTANYAGVCWADELAEATGLCVFAAWPTAASFKSVLAHLTPVAVTHLVQICLVDSEAAYPYLHGAGFDLHLLGWLGERHLIGPPFPEAPRCGFDGLELIHPPFFRIRDSLHLVPVCHASLSIYNIGVG